MSKQCRENLGTKQDSEDKTQKIQCYECKEFGYIAELCQATQQLICKTEQKQQNLAAETAAHFKFLSGVSPGEDLLVASGATSKMID